MAYRCSERSDSDDSTGGRSGYFLKSYYRGSSDSDSDDDGRGGGGSSSDDDRGSSKDGRGGGGSSSDDDRGSSSDGRGGGGSSSDDDRGSSGSVTSGGRSESDDDNNAYVLKTSKTRSSSSNKNSKSVLVLNPFQVKFESDDYEGRSVGNISKPYQSSSYSGTASKFYVKNAPNSNYSKSGKYFETRMRNVNLPSGARVVITSILNELGCSCPSEGANVNFITLTQHGPMSSREYRIVNYEMHKSLKYNKYKSYSIKKIVKVQNCCLWSKFRKREREIADKLGYVNERMLFHGSPAAETIAVHGFDISKANAGWFGRGAYFADNSALSNLYASRKPTKRRTMLFCRVAMGSMHVVPKIDRTIRQPPPPRHSVYGDVKIPEYVIYNNAQAYPEYLVYYDLVF